jgi:SAM-dependent methyltransferase
MKNNCMEPNLDREVVDAFGDEWTRFDQSGLSQKDREDVFDAYFSIFPWQALPEDAVGFDLGCGSGRWAKLVAPRVGELHCLDPSAATLDVAKRNLTDQHNCRFHLAGVEDIPLDDGSADFGYALGVLHHVSDTEMGIKACLSKLKKGAPFLLYLYYKFDNRPWWFRLVWRTSEIGRFLVSRAPYPVRYLLSQGIALTVYLPLSRFSLLLEKLGFNVDSVPLSFYRNRGLYVLRTDALDRFGTKLEKRYTKDEIRRMLERAGLEKIVFSDHAPYWCALGYRR